MAERPAAATDADIHVGAVSTTTHGRYLVVAPRTAGPAPMMVGFHGYAENADLQLQRLREIPGSERWLLVSIQALHRFYHRQKDVVASWMTRQDRELAIDDNVSYVENTLHAVRGRWPTTERTLFLGFSQGVAMAFRAAVRSRGEAGVVAVAGDVPPEIDDAALARLARVVILRGTADELYSAEQFAKDRERLQQVGVAVQSLGFTGAHEWTPETSAMIASVLDH
jgi:predicted esterase